MKVEGAMEADGVVEGFDVVKNHGMGDGAARRDEGAEAFGFEGGPERLIRVAHPAAVYLPSVDSMVALS